MGTEGEVMGRGGWFRLFFDGLMIGMRFYDMI